MASTRDTYDAIGIREDLSNIIYNISPEETPFMSGIGKSSCDNTLFEWQTDALADADAGNALVEGADADSMVQAETVRLTNYTQISGKTIQTSGTADAVDFAGQKSSHAYQMAKKAKELKLDMEKILLSTQAGSDGVSTTTARTTKAVGAWIDTIKKDNASSAGDIEGDIRVTMSNCYTAGAKPDTIMVDGALKQAISLMAQTVSPLQTTANATSAAHLVAAVDIYVSDFGNLKVVPNRLMPEKTGYFFDFEFWDIAYLRSFMTHDLARTGDSKTQQLLVEYGLRSKNENANAKVTGWVADA
jgi:hypothetical protein